MQLKLVEDVNDDFPGGVLVKIYKVSSANTTVLTLRFIDLDKPFHYHHREQQIH